MIYKSCCSLRTVISFEYTSMESQSTLAMFISEIPVRCRGQKSIRWIGDLTSRTTVHDVIHSVMPSDDTRSHSLSICAGRYRQVLPDDARIYKVVASFNQQRCARRLLFEVASHSKKRVRFADEIVVQNIQGRCLSDEKRTCNMLETVSMPIEKRLEKLKENFQKQIEEKQKKFSSVQKRSILRVINENLPAPVRVQTATIKQLSSSSSSESGISSSSSHEDFTGLETLV